MIPDSKRASREGAKEYKSHQLLRFWSFKAKMLFWQLPLLSVILINPHQGVLTKIREKRAVFDVLPTFRPDRKCRSKMEQKTKESPSEEKPEGRSRICSQDRAGRGRHVLKRMAAFMERRRSSKEIKNILRRMVFEQTLKTNSGHQEKQVLMEAPKDMKEIPEKVIEKKVSFAEDLVLGGLSVLELFLRIG